jgi:hypothetical protein
LTTGVTTGRHHSPQTQGMLGFAETMAQSRKLIYP